MPKCEPYTNRTIHAPIRKGGFNTLVAPLRGDDHEIIEAPVTRAECQAFPENDPFDAEPTFLAPAQPAVWTFGVATCHVICMYGWKLAGSWSSGVALLHLTDAHSIDEGLNACYGTLQAEGFVQHVTSYIIGGQPSSNGKLSALGNQAVFNTRGIVAPLTTDDGGAALVVATRKGMAFNVYDES